MSTFIHRRETDFDANDVIYRLNFHFYNGSGGHSVVSGPFSSPCEPGTDAFFSGYIEGDLTGVCTLPSLLLKYWTHNV